MPRHVEQLSFNAIYNNMSSHFRTASFRVNIQSSRYRTKFLSANWANEDPELEPVIRVYDDGRLVTAREWNMYPEAKFSDCTRRSRRRRLHVFSGLRPLVYAVS